MAAWIRNLQSVRRAFRIEFAAGALSFLASAAPAQGGVESTVAAPSVRRQDASRFAAFDDWFRRYRDGRVIYAPGSGRVPAGARIDTFDRSGEITSAIHDCLRVRGRAAAERLLALASFRFHDDDSVEAARFAQQEPWRVRDAALDALCQLSEKETVDYLTREVLLERERSAPARRRVAAVAAGRLRFKSALPALFSAANDPAPAVREAAINAALSLGSPKPATMRRWFADAVPEVRLRVLDAMSDVIARDDECRNDTDLQDAVIGALADADWRVRDGAVAILHDHPWKRAIDPLIQALRAETLRMKDGTGRKRVQTRIGAALGKMTGVEIPALDADRWQNWWNTASARFEFGEQTVGRPTTHVDRTSYFSIPIETDRMVFIVDASGSMAEPYGAPPLVTGDKSNVTYAPKEGRWTKLDRVKYELLRVVDALAESDRFQIVVFSDEPRTAFAKLENATKDVKRAAERFVLSLHAAGGTNLYDALASVMPLEGLPKPMLPDSADTLFVLTDGEPTGGKVVERSEILQRVASANRQARLIINTLFFGENSAPPAAFLANLAAQATGTYRRVQER